MNIHKYVKIVEQEQGCRSDLDYARHMYDVHTRSGYCALCHRARGTSRHHLVPRSVSSAYIKPKTVMLCIKCHRLVHQKFSNVKLKNEFYTRKRLRQAVQ